MEERLQKYMARCGVASRRKSEQYILEGIVKVNDTVINELGFKVDPKKDKVYVNDKLIEPEKDKVYIVLNKPEGYVTTLNDERGRKTILDLVTVDERIFPVGRLDYDSSGLLFLTNDGDVYNKVIHPRESIGKTYLALIEGDFSNSELNSFRSGLEIDGYITKRANIEIKESYKNNSSLVEITIYEGKNRQIRKMCSALGHEVLKLQRVSIGEITLENVEEGNWRYLNEKELDYIKSL
ncbi:pseudouridine synthase [Clostridium algidicarnis]|uniref:pseudouridine synthase n=1 Tax=Clostridium algidicarnis TaxID=37659 RepID=UPI00049509E0|nr:pseudouridine synthase [Clostridium algidicarnis]MBB6630152.1 rRNA pseudouridine synthase [Clostridium algidicarnis]MBU3194969.1 rRNA pseudouridine synthase [Clostridium algidicarnis]MBU3206306.1 rRNA pseudouridine synthase [Clostridium algidicarnis]MCB2285757.1 rRNA pseudouridine synthase [Clostridium algidicarnis]